MAISMCSEACAQRQQPYVACTGPVVSFEGCVLGEFERNGYDDSDFYAVVWDAAARTLRNITYASTRGPTTHNQCTVDITPENLAAVKDWAYGIVIKRGLDRAAIASMTVEWGRTVTVVRGRKVPKGTNGEVFWMGAGPARVGLRLADDSRVFIARDNVEVANPEQYRTPDAQVIEQAQRFVDHADLLSLANLVRVYAVAGMVAA